MSGLNGKKQHSVEPDKIADWVEALDKTIYDLGKIRDHIAGEIQSLEVRKQEGLQNSETIETIYEVSVETVEVLLEAASELSNKQEAALSFLDVRETMDQHVEEAGRWHNAEFVREVWQNHEECSVDELRSISVVLSEVISMTADRMEDHMIRGKEISEREINAFHCAYYKRPIIGYMAERAALYGPTPPTWEEVGYEDLLRPKLEYSSAALGVLYCLYLLLVENGRDYDSLTEMWEAVADLRGGQWDSARRAIERGNGLPRSLSDVQVFESVDRWRDYLKNKKDRLDLMS